MIDISSADLAALADALAKAQGEIIPPKKCHTATVPTKAGGSYSYRYSTLDELVDVLRVPLSKHGLAFTQTIVQGDHTIGVSTTILHASGQWLGTGIVLLPSGETPQSYGSALTYARRYSLGAAFGIAAEDDDDANAAARAVKAKKATPEALPPSALPPMKKASALTLTTHQQERLKALMKEHAVSAKAVKALVEKTYPIKTAADIMQKDYDDICAAVIGKLV